MHLRPLGPGMMQQIQSRCNVCNGTGYSCPPSKTPAAEGMRGALAAIGAISEPDIVWGAAVQRCLRGWALSTEWRSVLCAEATREQIALQLLTMYRNGFCSTPPPPRIVDFVAVDLHNTRAPKLKKPSAHLGCSCHSTRSPAPYPPAAPCPGDQCDVCKGKCLIPDKKTFEVHIEQGMKHGSKITLRGEAGCSEPGLAPGDIILVVVQKEHDVFQRANIDLVMEKSISLADALTGCSFTFKHLDGRVLRVTIPRGGSGEGARKPGVVRVVAHS